MRIRPQAKKLLTTTLILIVLFGILSMLIALATSAADFNYPYNLSRSAELGIQAGKPALVEYNGFAAIAWSEGYNNKQDTKDNGSILLAIADETNNYWYPQTVVFTATRNKWATDPDIVFDTQTITPTVHIVWAQANSCNGIQTNCKYEAIYHTQCQIANNLATCSPAVEVDTDTTSGVAYRNPSLTQDNLGNLHVVWTDENHNKVYYRRGIIASAGDMPTWQTHQQVTQANNGKTPLLHYSNGRLHFVWKDNVNKNIRYLFDDSPTDNTLTGTSVSFALPTGYSEARNPTLDALGNIVYIAFDLQKSNTTDTFALVHTRSTDNGSNWSPILKDIPGQNSPGNYQNYTSNTDDLTQGLQPQLVITATASITRLNVAWHDIQSAGEGSAFQIHHTWTTVDPNDGFDQAWHTPVVNVTADKDSVAPALASNNHRWHIAYRRAAGTLWDTYYRGFIAGTIDPEYMETAMQLAHTVTPTLILTTANSIDAAQLIYTIVLTNTGNVNAVQTHITHTLPSKINAVTAVASTGSPTYNNATHQLRWQGNIPSQSTVSITVTATTQNNVTAGTLVSQVNVWSANLAHTIPLSATAQTQIVTTPGTVLNLQKSVSPRHIVTNTQTLPATDLNYTIRLTNLSNTTINNLYLTDPFADIWWWYLSNSEALCNFSNCGTVSIIGDDYDILTWRGFLPPGESVTIQFTAHSSARSDPVHPITNTVSLVNPSNNDVLLSDTIVTVIGPLQIYLPLVLK